MTAVQDLPTPALVVDTAAFEHNLAAMAAALPGARCRPHVKAHKTTALARAQAARGHRTFTCATPREMEGMANAGLGDDLLLANEVVDPDRLRRLAALDARVTIAVDSEVTIDAAARCRSAGGPRSTCSWACLAAAALLSTPGGSPTPPRPRPDGAGRDGLRGSRRGGARPGDTRRADRGGDAPAPRRARVTSAASSSPLAGPGRSTSTVGHRDPGRLVRARWTPRTAISTCRFELALSIVATVISVSRVVGRRRLRAQGAGHGPRRPDGHRSHRVVLL